VSGALSERTRPGPPVKRGSSNLVKRDGREGVPLGRVTGACAKTTTTQDPLMVTVTLSHVPWRGC
jgi:hypothetical protein